MGRTEPVKKQNSRVGAKVLWAIFMNQHVPIGPDRDLMYDRRRKRRDGSIESGDYGLNMPAS
jgi:hypothetical protein